ncbi:cob(I)yrinic acid a,c-diamide adenosyltransferase [Rubrobacter aplysinae]|uniref:cob(I)yrinic acid a,c-diamide adenosyltransferase n=1 Tax=Rubrobacter aplysinae TaxID=909625 RepID=UPI00064C205D|nr:cob(I)yrinic acid a,c-diamide adenosyltransferase [Rubrobacter aplysinae]
MTDRDPQAEPGEYEEPVVSTGRGDDGTTTLLGAGRMSKHDARIEALGDVDEASSALGAARAEASTAGGSSGELAGMILEMQRLLYRVMGDLAMPQEDNFVGAEDVELVDRTLSEWKSRTRLPNEFVIPGGSRLGALLDVSRSVVRRAERRLVAAGLAEDAPEALRTVNRLSDVLFVVARNADGHNEPSRR